MEAKLSSMLTENNILLARLCSRVHNANVLYVWIDTHRDIVNVFVQFTSFITSPFSTSPSHPAPPYFYKVHNLSSLPPWIKVSPLHRSSRKIVLYVMFCKYGLGLGILYYFSPILYCYQMGVQSKRWEKIK